MNTQPVEDSKSIEVKVKSELKSVAYLSKQNHEFVHHPAGSWNFTKDEKQQIQYECPADEAANRPIQPEDPRDGHGFMTSGDQKWYGYIHYGKTLVVVTRHSVISEVLKYHIHVLM